MNGGVWILGAGGHAKVAIAVMEAMGIAVAGLFDDDAALHGRLLLGHAVAGPIPDPAWWAQTGAEGHMAIGSNRVRQRLARAAPAGTRWRTAIHPSAVVHPSAVIGEGTLVCARAVIQPDARIGRHVIVNTGAIVEHDCQVGDCAHLAPGSVIAGEVIVEAFAFLGVCACVIPGRRVGAAAVVGAGATVIRDVPANSTVAGVPARPLPAAAGRCAAAADKA